MSTPFSTPWLGGRHGRRLVDGREGAEVVERQAVHVGLDHHLLVEDVVVRRLRVVLVECSHPLLSDRATGVDVVGEVVHQPLGEVDQVRVPVAEAGVADVDGGLRGRVRLRPVLEPLLVVRRDRRGERVRDVQRAVTADGEQQPAGKRVRRVDVPGGREARKREWSGQARRLGDPMAVMRPDCADVWDWRALEERIQQVLPVPAVGRGDQRAVARTRQSELSRERIARRLRSVREERVTGRQRALQVQMPLRVVVLLQLSVDVSRRLDQA